MQATLPVREILIKTGSGRQDFGGATTYSGTTTIQDGSILVAALGTLGDASSPTVVQNGATLELGALTHNEPVTLQDGAILSGDGAAFQQAAVTLDVGANVTIRAFSTFDTVTFNGDFLGGGAGISFEDGNFVLGGSSAATAPTSITNGDLFVNGLHAADITVGSSGTLLGSGQVGAITTQPGGAVAPGNSPGILTSADFNLGFWGNSGNRTWWNGSR